MNKSILYLFSGIAVSLAFTSCIKSRGNNTGIEYAPDMYYSKGYEPYSQADSNTVNPYGINMRTPVQGSVAVGQLDYQYPFANTLEGYEAAGKSIFMPSLTIAQQQEGERLYGIYCSVCHGVEGIADASATVSYKQASVKPSWSNYQSATIKALPVGKMYHTVTYGKNNMGSYASALNPQERWAVLSYVKRLSMRDSASGKIPAISGDYVNTSVFVMPEMKDTAKTVKKNVVEGTENKNKK